MTDIRGATTCHLVRAQCFIHIVAPVLWKCAVVSGQRISVISASRLVLVYETRAPILARVRVSYVKSDPPVNPAPSAHMCVVNLDMGLFRPSEGSGQEHLLVFADGNRPIGPSTRLAHQAALEF